MNIENYPKISIVTVSYNQCQFIEENILSVINQDYPNVEHIIIDAGSTDGTLEILKKYDKHLNWVSEPDKGQSDGLNKGFRKATGDIIGWINSDDCLAPGALKKVGNFFKEHPDEIAVTGDQAYIDEAGNQQSIVKSKPYSYDYLVNHAIGVTQNSTFFRRLVFDKIGYLDESLHYAMDHELFIRIASLKEIPYIPETLAYFRIQEDAKTAKGRYYFSRELIKIRKKYNGSLMSPAIRTDYFYVAKEPLRRIKWLRNAVHKLIDD